MVALFSATDDVDDSGVRAAKRRTDEPTQRSAQNRDGGSGSPVAPQVTRGSDSTRPFAEEVTSRFEVDPELLDRTHRSTPPPAADAEPARPSSHAEASQREATEDTARSRFLRRTSVSATYGRPRFGRVVFAAAVVALGGAAGWLAVDPPARFGARPQAAERVQPSGPSAPGPARADDEAAVERAAAPDAERAPAAGGEAPGSERPAAEGPAADGPEPPSGAEDPGFVIEEPPTPAHIERLSRRERLRRARRASELAGRLYGWGRLERSEHWLRRAWLLRPDDATTACHLSRVLLDQGRLEEARAWAERAMELRPELASSHVALGRVYHAAGDPEAAVVVFERAMELEPDDPRARRLRRLALRDVE